ncbi:hypothetical protein [Candidatus Contubernalis alkaliaceticus]|uniref:hypothetical protein n=1 Tax=Candidatus Contubernalis alkaliaceticus TaxID=338645 RepID=UPI001F4C27D3|nr:hypothetical protein [Candidatus Contubernalis alkalaceticus]UNC91865.1 hypothetical protein HUE98_06995 [Candidatus Contubernalis alkalaceticus]
MIKNIKWPVVLVAFLFLISIFYGFQFYQEKQTVEEPLVKLFDENEKIKEVDISQQGDVMNIMLQLEYVSNLREEENIINKEVLQILGNRKYRVTFTDHRNQELESIYYKVHYHLQEAAVKGNFVEMAERVGVIMHQFDVEDYRLIVGEDKIFFQVKQSNHYLFEIVPRLPGTEGKEPVGESGNL